MEEEEEVKAEGKTAEKGLTLPLKCAWCDRVSVTADPIGRGWIHNPETGKVMCVSCVHGELDGPPH